MTEIEQTQLSLTRLAEVKEMAASAGYQIIKQHFKDIILENEKQLVNEDDFKKVRRLQERIRAYCAMLETVDSLCQEHSETFTRLESMVEDKHERDQYGLD